jgi:hypothetical protein
MKDVKTKKIVPYPIKFPIIKDKNPAISAMPASKSIKL